MEKLRPVSFAWKDDGQPDLGLVAEEVKAVEPQLVTYNDKGEVEGVKYDRVSLLLINAIKEQQARLQAQQSQIQALTRMVCSDHPDAQMCNAAVPENRR